MGKFFFILLVVADSLIILDLLATVKVHDGRRYAEPQLNCKPAYDESIARSIELAHEVTNTKAAKRSTTLPDSARAYRKRRGRHPPPGFDAWHGRAINNDVFIV